MKLFSKFPYFTKNFSKLSLVNFPKKHLTSLQDFRDISGIFHKEYLLNTYDMMSAINEKEKWKRFMEIDSILIIEIVQADGVISKEELKKFKTIQVQYGMSEEHVDEVLRNYLNKKLSNEELKTLIEDPCFKEIADIMGRSVDKHLSCVLLSALEIAVSDGLDKRELKKAFEIGKALGLNEETCEKIKKTFELETSLLKAYKDLI